MLAGIIALTLFTGLAFCMGKLISKIQLPAILGWLLTGMLIGPHALNLMNDSIMSTDWFHIVLNIGEVFVGMLIGSELILKDLKQSGKQIATICIFEGMGAFLFVAFAFLLIADVPFSIAMVFGAIALATAPAPSLSIVKEYNAKGPVAKTLIPLAALDDVLAVLVFFLVIGFVSGSMSGEGVNVLSILMMVIIPLALGAIVGFIGSKVLSKETSKKQTILTVFLLIIGIVTIGKYVNENIVSINLLLAGITFSGVIVNAIEHERAHQIMKDINPIIFLALIVMIVNLGAPLDYQLIFGAGLLTAVYIIARAAGKIIGTYAGGRLSKAEDNVCKYLGFAMLPHSGVSLVFTGIAVTSLTPFVPEYATMIQGTIAAAAVINEIIAVFLAKQAFKQAGEIQPPNTVEVEVTETEEVELVTDKADLKYS